MNKGIIVTVNGTEVIIDKRNKSLFDSKKWRLVRARQIEEKYYVISSCKGKTLYLHRIIMNATKGQTVDHRNRNTLDCRIHNLRITTQSINRLNCGVRKNKKSSAYKGVFKRHRNSSKPYYSMIQLSDRKTWVGSFKTELDAYNAYITKLKSLEMYYG